MNFREDRPSLEQDEISRLRKKLQIMQQKVASLELENQSLRQSRGRGSHTGRQEGSENYLRQPHLSVDVEESIVPGYPIEELPNLEDEEFTWGNVLLYGGEDEKKMEKETWEKDIPHQEEDIEKKHKSEPPDEGCCMFCSRTIISEGDESEHYRHCPEYNRWTGSENNSFYSPHYYPSSYSTSSNYSPSTMGCVSPRNGLPL